MAASPWESRVWYPRGAGENLPSGALPLTLSLLCVFVHVRAGKQQRVRR